jgi:hypothetical protein
MLQGMDRQTWLRPQQVDELAALRGQMQALQALVLGLAQVSVGAQDFRAAALARLDMLRDALLPLPVAEAELAAVDATAAWVEHVTDQVQA